MRIDSPGGGITARDAVYHRIKTFAAEQEIPVVASLGGLATSGGYYPACTGDVILAQPTTVTGSIGGHPGRHERVWPDGKTRH